MFVLAYTTVESIVHEKLSNKLDKTSKIYYEFSAAEVLFCFQSSATRIILTTNSILP